MSSDVARDCDPQVSISQNHGQMEKKDKFEWAGALCCLFISSYLIFFVYRESPRPSSPPPTDALAAFHFAVPKLHSQGRVKQKAIKNRWWVFSM